MYSISPDRPWIRRLGIGIVAAMLFVMVSRVFEIEFTPEIRMQIYVATAAGLGLVFTREAVTNLLRDAGRSSEYLINHTAYQELGANFLFVWMLLFLVVSVLLIGAPSLFGFLHIVVIAFAFVVGLSGVIYSDLTQKLIEVFWLFVGVISAVVVVYCLYIIVESIIAMQLEALSFSQAVEFIDPVLAATILIGLIENILGGITGPTTRDLERNRTPTVVSITTDSDKEFLSAVSKLAEIYTEESTVADRSNGEQSAGSHLTICVNGSPEGRFRIPTNEEDSSQDFSRIVGELSDPDQRWVLRDSPPAFPADVESEQYLTVKIQKDVPNPSLRDRLLLRLQGLKR